MKAPSKPPRHTNWELLNIVLLNLHKITRMLKGSDLWIWLWLWLTDPLWKYLCGAATLTLIEMVLWVIGWTSSCFFLVYFKFQRASKLHYWFKSYGVFAWICQADNRVYSAHWHCQNCNLILEIPRFLPGGLRHLTNW